MGKNVEKEQAEQTAHDTQEVYNEDKTPDEELRELMQLPLYKIAELPAETQARVWEEYGKQLAELTELNGQAAQRLLENFSRLKEKMEPTIKTFQAIAEQAQKIKDIQLLPERTREALHTWGILEPYIAAEIDEHPELYETDTDETDRRIIAAAAKRARADGKEIPLLQAEEAEAASAEELPRVISKQALDLLYPVDKPNNVIWNLLEVAEPNGQVELQIDTKSRTAKKESIIYYGISFSELDESLKITKQLTPYDKRVYIAVGGLYNAGNNVISASQIYEWMGNTGRPKTDDVKKINDSLTKMSAARIFIDNEIESENYKNYDRIKYDGSLLPFERGRAYINNVICETAVHIFREPPLITFARKHNNQITTIERKLLESPISKTDANLRIDDYLIERISRMTRDFAKSSSYNGKLTFETIFKNCNVTSRLQKHRAPEKIQRYLEHYKKCGFINDFSMYPDYVEIKVPLQNMENGTNKKESKPEKKR